jgi:hypothetical protein
MGFPSTYVAQPIPPQMIPFKFGEPSSSAYAFSAHHTRHCPQYGAPRSIPSWDVRLPTLWNAPATSRPQAVAVPEAAACSHKREFSLSDRQKAVSVHRTVANVAEQRTSLLQFRGASPCLPSRSSALPCTLGLVHVRPVRIIAACRARHMYRAARSAETSALPLPDVSSIRPTRRR